MKVQQLREAIVVARRSRSGRRNALLILTGIGANYVKARGRLRTRRGNEREVNLSVQKAVLVSDEQAIRHIDSISDKETQIARVRRDIEYEIGYVRFARPERL
jgi:hypothetical protein